MTLPLDPSPERILITRLRFIGDVTLTTPVIRALRKRYPGAWISYLTERGPDGILEGHPDLNEVLVLDRERISQRPVVSRLLDHLRLLRSLRAGRFDLVIDLFGNPRSALLAWVTGARVRVGYDVRVRGAVYNLKIRRSSSLRVTDAYLDAVRTLGIAVEDAHTCISCNASETQWAADWLRKHGLAERHPLIGLHPGASWPAKIWSASQFASLADRLVEAHRAAIVMVHGPEQRPLAEAVASSMRHAPVILDTEPLKRLAAILQRCDTVVSNDSGPMHIAAAVGTPTVGLFGPSRPDIWFPYASDEGHTGIRADVPDCCGQDFCMQSVPCITKISVEAVFTAVEHALRSGKKSASHS